MTSWEGVKERRAITFEVRGIPIPKGSTKAFRHPSTGAIIVTATNLKTKPWQEQIRAVAQTQAPPTIWTGAVTLTLKFGMPRPRSLPKRVREHVKKPDLDKLIRCVLDALKGVIYLDDSQVVLVEAHKVYAETPGIIVEVRPTP